MLRFLTLLFLLLLPSLSLAESTEEMHLQAAFVSAKKKAWDEAIAHAQAAKSNILVKYFLWEYLKDPEAEAKFKDISNFIDQNPNWPDQEVLIRRAEAALLSEMPSDEVLDDWYAAHPPRTNLGKKRSIKDKEALNDMIRESWAEDDYTKIGEAKVLVHYADILRPQDHAKRIERLLWAGKTDDAKRLLVHAPSAKRALYEARISLIRNESRAPRDVSNVPSSQQGDAGLLYDRMRWRYKHDDKDGVRDILLITPQTVPYPEKWWNYRERYIREAIGEGNIATAEKLLSRHAQPEDSVQGKEALWLKGWLELEFKDHPRNAYDIFEKLYDGMETPFGKARTAYWVGRAAERAGVKPTEWYQLAARYNTTFYGQLALHELEDSPTLTIEADDSDTSAEQKKAFASRELVKLVHVLAKAKQSNLASKFILFMVDTAKSPQEAVLASQLGLEINRIDIGVRASKKALRDGVVALKSGYPVIKIISEIHGLPKTYVLALIRQESEFFSDAVSSSNALGLMQLLPSTAREVARKEKLLPFTVDRLFEPDYNMRLGTKYLSNMVNRFDGSYVMAAASYNAGPGRVRQWLNGYGAPASNMRAVVNWIEGIPFNETRNYVQHVLGNKQVYAYILNEKRPTKLTLRDDLERGAASSN